MSDDWLPNETPLGQARGWVQARALDGGARCPCCGQRAQVYRRTINSGMARSLAIMYGKAGTTAWINVPDDVGARSREEGKLRYWGLIVEKGESRGDGGRSGWWRVTDSGAAFVLGELTVPKYALVYDGNLLGLEGEPVDFATCARDKFDLAELLGRRGA